MTKIENSKNDDRVLHKPHEFVTKNIREQTNAILIGRKWYFKRLEHYINKTAVQNRVHNLKLRTSITTSSNQIFFQLLKV